MAGKNEIIGSKVLQAKPGSIVQIPVDREGHFHTYGQILKDGYWIFFDCRRKKEEDATVDEVLNSPVIFSGSVAKYFIKDIVKKRIWTVKYEGRIIPETESRVKPTFWQSRDDKNRCIILNYDNTEYAAKPEECIELEMMQIWLFENAQERIYKYYALEPYEIGSHYKLRL